MPKKAEQKISDVQGKALDRLYQVQQRARKRKNPVRGYGLTARDKAGRSWNTDRLGPALFKKGFVVGCTPEGEYKADYTWYYRLTEKGEALAKARVEARVDAKGVHMDKCAEYDKEHTTYFATVRVSMDLVVGVTARNIQEVQEKILAGRRGDCAANGFGKVYAVAPNNEEQDRTREVVDIKEVLGIEPHRLHGELYDRAYVDTPNINDFREAKDMDE